MTKKLYTRLIGEATQNGVYTITLNRPEKRNALDISLIEELLEAFESAHNNQQFRVIILKGEGPVFCSGLDLKQRLDPKEAEYIGERLADLFDLVYNSPLITLAKIHGAAIAGGMGLAACCDISIAEENTIFAFPEVTRGLVPALVMSLLKRQIKEKSLKELLFLGEQIDATKAKEIGLINCSVPKNSLQSTVQHYIDKALMGSPEAIVITKRLLTQLTASSFPKDLEIALRAHKMARTHRDAQEGIEAFIEKRKTYWQI